MQGWQDSGSPDAGSLTLGLFWSLDSKKVGLQWSPDSDIFLESGLPKKVRKSDSRRPDSDFLESKVESGLQKSRTPMDSCQP